MPCRGPETTVTAGASLSTRTVRRSSVARPATSITRSVSTTATAFVAADTDQRPQRVADDLRRPQLPGGVDVDPRKLDWARGLGATHTVDPSAEDPIAAVQALKAKGTTVILVEQSVNVALTIADTAYFMEKGEIRFNGPTDELLQRPEILRSEFLAGAGTATEANGSNGSAKAKPVVPRGRGSRRSPRN